MKPLNRRRFLTRSVGLVGAGGVGAALGAGLTEQASANQSPMTPEAEPPNNP